MSGTPSPSPRVLHYATRVAKPGTSLGVTGFANDFFRGTALTCATLVLLLCAHSCRRHPRDRGIPARPQGPGWRPRGFSLNLIRFNTRGAGRLGVGHLVAGRAGKPVVFVDKRPSSFDAEQQLIGRKRAGERLTRRRKKEQLDATAAAAFLQAFLDVTSAPIEP